MLNSANKPIKAIVIGLGNIGFAYDRQLPDRFIFSHTRAYLKNKQTKLLSGIDLDKRKQKDFARITGAPAFTSLKEFVKNNKERPDIISVCAPTARHLKIFKEALSLKPRMIILEKPLSFSLKTARQIVNLAEKANVLILINYQRRFSGYFQALQKEIRGNKYGKFLRGFVKYRGGVYNSASHAINLLHFLLGDLQTSLSFNKQNLAGGDFSADFILQSNKAPIYFSGFSKTDFNVSEYDLFFEKARLLYLDTAMQLKIELLGKSPFFKGYKQFFPKKTIILRDLFKYQANVIDKAVKILKKQADNISSGEDGLVTMKIIEQIRCKRS